VSWNDASYSFGRADQLDRAAIERLIAALTRVVDVEAVPAGPILEAGRHRAMDWLIAVEDKLTRGCSTRSRTC
jgi:hypothetical protein